MAWSESDITALETAIKQGTVRVKFADREITYRSLDEMIRLRDLMISSVRGKPRQNHTLSAITTGVTDEQHP